MDIDREQVTSSVGYVSIRWLFYKMTVTEMLACINNKSFWQHILVCLNNVSVTFAK